MMTPEEYKWVHVEGVGTLLCGLPRRLIDWNRGHIWCEEDGRHNIFILEKRVEVKYYLCPVCYTDEDIEIATIHLIGDIGK
jgi:hypothetical protein